MTSNELLSKMGSPFNKKIYLAQLNDRGLDFNTSDLFSRLIKDAARCNRFNSDIYYDLQHIEEQMKSFNPEEEFEPIWLGFRKSGVDCTGFVLCKTNEEQTYGNLSNNYFALYVITVEKEKDELYNVILNEYYV